MINARIMEVQISDLTLYLHFHSDSQCTVDLVQPITNHIAMIQHSNDSIAR